MIKFPKAMMAALLLSVPISSNATPNTSSPGNILSLSGGWSTADVRAQLSIPFYNPEHCALSDGYITDPSLSGTQLFNSMLLSSYISHVPVSVVVDGCSLDRPRIIGVNLGF